MAASQPDITPANAAASLLALAAQHHRNGRPAEAAALYRKVMELQPERSDVLLLLGMALSEGPDLAEAEALLRKYLAQVPENAAALYAIGKIYEIKRDDPAAIQWFERAAASDPRHVPSWNGLGAAHHRNGRLPEAAVAFLRARELDLNWPLLRYNLATVYFDQAQFELAEREYRETLRLDPAFLDAKLMLASSLDQQHRSAEAEVYMEEYARESPVTVKPCQGPKSLARVLIVLGAGMCNVRTDFLFGAAIYETITVYIRRKEFAAHIPDRREIPTFDIVFSALADADRADAFMAEGEAFCASLEKPVLNPPDERIARTRRDLLPAVLSGIEGLVMPPTRRVVREEIAEMASTDRALATPLLVRPCGTHGGKYFTKIERTAALAPYLDSIPAPEHYLTPYHEYRSADGYHRKYRFIFIDREVYPYHLAIMDDWLVHYHRTDMANQAWMRAEEEAYLADYRSAFPRALGEAVRAVAKRLDLDYAGMDCSITPDGRLLVFEANAAMLVHLIDSAEIYPYKHRYVPRIAEAIAALVRRRLA